VIKLLIFFTNRKPSETACLSTICPYVNMNRCKFQQNSLAKFLVQLKRQTLIHKEIYSIQPKFYAEQIGIEAGSDTIYKHNLNKMLNK
jgi:hypothetical protein